jgi:hypothetical protein
MAWRWILLWILLWVAMSGGIAQARPSKGVAALVPVPADALVIAATTLDELRAFPEMAGTSAGREFAKTQKVVDAEGLDTLYQTEKSYGDTVAFFDQALKEGGFQVLARTVTRTATAWTARRPDRTLSNVVVRATTPLTTFEVAESQSRGPIPQIR